MPQSIVIVEDEPDIAGIVELWLTSEGFDVAVAGSGEEALELVTNRRPDLVILDVMLPDMDGLEVCKRLRADHRTAPVAIIMLTARTMTADRVAGLVAGADDYVTKPFEPEELLARVRTTLQRASDLRGTSPLTGLPGNFEIQRLLERLIDEDAPFVLLHVDLSGFKAYNDRYGFIRGDRAIAATAQILDELVVALPGEPAFLGHIGGDDFAIVVNPDAAEALAAAIVERFDATSSALYDEQDARQGYVETVDRQGVTRRTPLVTISVGIASAAERRYTSSAELASVATEMKQLAKQESRSAWRVDQRRA